MGALNGTLTYTTYYVLDEPPAGFKERFLESLQKHAFREIDVDAGKDRSIGWVRLGDVFDTELPWDRVFVDPYVCMTLREDTIKVPPNALKAHLGKREKEHLRASGREKLGKGERAAIKADVLLGLRRRALPDIKSYDVVWNTVDASMRLWTHNKRIKEVFEDLVRETWGLRIVPQAPYTAIVARGAPVGLDAAELEKRVLELSPTDFTGRVD